jgi:hypothetical protein
MQPTAHHYDASVDDDCYLPTRCIVLQEAHNRLSFCMELAALGFTCLASSGDVQLSERGLVCSKTAPLLVQIMDVLLPTLMVRMPRPPFVAITVPAQRVCWRNTYFSTHGCSERVVHWHNCHRVPVAQHA